MLVLRIAAIQQETAECKTFCLSSEVNINYEAGQFLTFLFDVNGREIRRSYSLSSAPTVDDQLSVTIKRTSNGEISRWWLEEAKVGDLLKALPPAGMFTIRQSIEKKDLFFAAAGSGITPVYSMIKSVLSENSNIRIVLVYSNSSPGTTIFLKQLQSLQTRYPDHFFIEWFFSSNQNLHQARLSTYNLQRVIQKYLSFNIEDALMFTCGPYYFMQMVQITCMTMGFSKTNFRKELFDINALPPLPRRYFDKKDRTVILSFLGKTHKVFVPYWESILDAALNQGINLPYSCKAGKCSTCSCRILSGKIWMHYNEVLTDEDQAIGIALTCTGHPATEDLSIEIV